MDSNDKDFIEFCKTKLPYVFVGFVDNKYPQFALPKGWVWKRYLGDSGMKEID